MKYEFLIQGSEATPYKVKIERRGDKLTATCSCKAGLNGQHCKHRLALLRGEANAVVSGNGAEVAQLPELLIGTDVESAINEVIAAEAGAESAKRRVSKAKAELGKILMK